MKRRLSATDPVVLGDYPSDAPMEKDEHWEKELAEALRDNELLKHKMALKDVLTDLKLEAGMDRVEKK